MKSKKLTSLPSGCGYPAGRMSSDPQIKKTRSLHQGNCDQMARGGIRSDHCDSSRYERGSVDSALSLGQKRARKEANSKQEDQKSPSNTGHPLRENRFFF